jgi:hypothetical protein
MVGRGWGVKQGQKSVVYVEKRSRDKAVCPSMHGSFEASLPAGYEELMANSFIQPSRNHCCLAVDAIL